MAEPYHKPSWERKPHERLKEVKPAASATGGGASPYALGRKFEYSVKGQLERRSYFVMRAPSSKGKVDLLAVGTACLEKGITGLFIQVKRRGTIGSEEWNAVYEIATSHGGWGVIAMRESPKTTSYFRIDAPRVPRSPKREWTRINPTDCSELLPPPTLL